MIFYKMFQCYLSWRITGCEDIRNIHLPGIENMTAKYGNLPSSTFHNFCPYLNPGLHANPIAWGGGGGGGIYAPTPCNIYQKFFFQKVSRDRWGHNSDVPKI